METYSHRKKMIKHTPCRNLATIDIAHHQRLAIKLVCRFVTEAWGRHEKQCECGLSVHKIFSESQVKFRHIRISLSAGFPFSGGLIYCPGLSSSLSDNVLGGNFNCPATNILHFKKIRPLVRKQYDRMGGVGIAPHSLPKHHNIA